ncbi:hypothetical protein THAOC_12142, partial [Thalassiosira oceanica]
MGDEDAAGGGSSGAIFLSGGKVQEEVELAPFERRACSFTLMGMVAGSTKEAPRGEVEHLSPESTDVLSGLFIFPPGCDISDNYFSTPCRHISTPSAGTTAKQANKYRVPPTEEPTLTTQRAPTMRDAGMVGESSSSSMALL